MDLHESLPAGNYVVKMDPFENFFLEAIDSQGGTIATAKAVVVVATKL